MTSGADRDGKAHHPRRARRTQLHEAGAAALAQLQPQSPSDLAAPEGASALSAKSSRPIPEGSLKSRA
jgi:hypothetical protein